MKDLSDVQPLDKCILIHCLGNDDAYYQEVKDLFRSSHRYTRVCNNPASGTLQELLKLSKYLKRPPLSFYEEYDFGVDTLSTEELQLLEDAEVNRARHQPHPHNEPTQCRDFLPEKEAA